MGTIAILLAMPTGAQVVNVDLTNMNSWTVGVSNGSYTPTVTNGWLRMTSAATQEATYVVYNGTFNGANTSVYADFYYRSYGGSGADGINFFLYDASKNTATNFQVGYWGGSLGYANFYDNPNSLPNNNLTTPGMAGGYLGVGLDEFGNYSYQDDSGYIGSKNGGPGFTPNAIAVRGPGVGANGYEPTGYQYLGGTSSLSTALSTTSTTAPTSGAGFAHVVIYISATNQLTVSIARDSTSAVTPILSIDLSSYDRPDQLGFGFTGATGGSTNIHEISQLTFAAIENFKWQNAMGNSAWSTLGNWSNNTLVPGSASSPYSDVLLDNTYVSSAQTITVSDTKTLRTLTIDAPFNYTLNSGTFSFSGSNGTGSGIFVTGTNGSTATQHTINTAINMEGSIQVSNSSGALLYLGGNITTNGNKITFSGTGDTNVAGSIDSTASSGSVLKTGTGTLLLSGVSNYTGTTEIQQGTIKLNDNNRLSAASSMNISGGTLNLNGYSQRVAALTFTNGSIDYGTTGTANSFLFNNIGAAPSGVITIDNWESALDMLATQNGSLSSTYLSQFYFAGYGTGATLATSSIAINGYGSGWYTLTPVAATWYTWDGQTSNVWNLATNWSPDGAPGSNANIAFGTASAGNRNVSLNGNQVVNAIRFDAGGSGSYNIGNGSATYTLTFGTGTGTSFVQQKSDTYAQTISAPVALASNTVVDMIGSQSLTMSGVVSGAGNLVKEGSGGKLILSGANTYTGNTYINNGTLQISTNTGLGTTAGKTVVANGGALELTNAITTAEAIDISGTGVSSGGAIRSVSGNNTLSGTISLVDASRIQVDANTLTLAGSVVSSSGRDLSLGGNGNITLNGSIATGSGGVSVGMGAVGNIVTLSGSSSFRGSLSISQGTVRLAASERLNDMMPLVMSGGVFDMANYSETVGSLAGTAGSVTMGSGILTLGDANTSTSFAGTISGTGGSLLKRGTGTLSLSGTNTYTGGTTLSAGALSLSNNSALGTGTVTLSGGLLTSTASNTIANVVNLTGDASITNMTVGGTFTQMNGSRTLTLDNATLAGATNISNSGTNYNFTVSVSNGATSTISGVLDDGSTSLAGQLTKTGGGTLILSGANTYAGATTVNAGALNVRNSLGLGTTGAGTSVASGAELQLQGGIAIGAEAVTINGTGMSSSGAIRNISGNNSLAGLITMGSDSRINSDSGTLTLDVANGNAITGAGLNLTVGGAGNVTINDPINITTGVLTKDGSGTLTLAGTNTFTGGAVINAGTLTLGSATSLSNSLPVTVNGGTFNLNNFSETIGSLAGSGGNVTLGSATLNTGAANSSTVFSGSISGTGGLTKTGTGTMTLAGASSYSGATNVNSGALNVQNAMALGSTAGGTTVAAGAELQLQGGISVGSEALSITGTGLSSSGALHNVSGNNTWGGTITLAGATTIASDSGTLTVDVASGNAISGNATNLTVGGAGNVTIADPIATTSGTLTKVGAGVLTLSGASTYTGQTRIDAGTLRLGVSNAINYSTTNTLNMNGGTLDLNGNSQHLYSLAVNADSVIDFGSQTGANYLLFENHSGTQNGVLTINNYQNGTDVFGVNNANAGTFTTAILSSIYFSGYGPGAQLGTATSSLSGYSGTWRPINPVGALTGTVWISNSDTSWATTGNWNGANVPDTNTELAVFDGTGSQTNVNASAAYTMLGIRFSGNRSYTIANNSSITLTTAATNGIAYIQQYSAYTQSILGGTINLGRDVVFDLTNTGDLAISSVLANTTGNSLTKAGSGSGALILSGANTYTGATYLTAGITRISNATALGTTAGATTVSSGAELQIQGGISVAEPLTINGTGTATTGVVRNLSGTNTLSGTVTLASDSRINSDAGTLTLSGAIGGAGLNLTVGGVGNTTIQGVVGTGTGGLTKDGAGTLTLSGANTYSGNTTISSGVVAIQNAGALGTPTSGNTLTSVSSGAQLQLSGGITVAREDLTLNGTGISSDGALRNTSGANSWSGGITLGSDSRINSDAGTLSISGAISGTGQNLTVGGSGNVTLTSTGSLGTGAGSLTKDGSGTLTLAGNTTETGGTTINAGTVTLGAAERLADSGAVTVNTGGTLNLAGYNETIGSLAGSGGSVTLGSGTLTAGGANTNTTYSGVISGAGSFTKTGSGTTTLAGSNTYTGATTISAGTLALGTNQAISSSSAVTIASGATFDINGQTETLNKLSSTGGTLAIGSGTLTVGDSTNTTLSGNITSSSTGTLIKQGTGILTISSNVNIAGTVQVNSGSTLEFVNGATISNLTLNGGTLKLGGIGTSYNINNLTINGASTIDFTGSVTLNSVTLTTNSGATLTITSWTELQDYFFATTWKTSATDPGTDYTNAPARNTAPLNQVNFSEYNQGGTSWVPWAGGHGQITPVPEPSVYGAIFMGGAVSFAGIWRFLRRKDGKAVK